MLISKDSMRKRCESANQIMKDNGLEAIFLIGDRQPGEEMSGDLQFFVNNYIWYRRHCVLLFPNQEPVLISGACITSQKVKEYLWIEDCRETNTDDELYNTIAAVLKERGVKSGLVGANLYCVSVIADKVIREAIPGVKLVDVHPEIMKLRLNPGKEERELIKRGSELCDGAYEHVLRFIKPGVTQNKLRGELDNYIIGSGADDVFNGVSSGRYSIKAGKNKLGYSTPPVADFREIERGDTIWLEITPRFDGYWSQLVRFVSVSEPNAELEEVHSFVLKALQATIEGIKPGETIGSMVRAMKKKFPAFTSDYKVGNFVGHICGLDLTDGNLTDDSEVIMTPGMALIVHPSIVSLDGSGEIFSGETYMVTETGYERLMKSDDKIHVV